MIGSIPFEIPAKYAADLASGSIVRFGGLLKDASTGRIVAHLQETGSLAQRLGAQLLNVSPFDGVSAISSLAGNMQLAKIQKTLELLQIQQWLTLGSSLVGIGVSLAGFKMMSDRFDRLDQRLDAFKEHIDRRFDELVERDYRNHLSRVRDLLREAESAYTYRNPDDRFMRVAESLESVISFLRSEIDHNLGKKGTRNEETIKLLWSLIEGFVTGINARVQCLAEAGEMTAAADLSRREAEGFYRFFDGFSAVDWVNAGIDPAREIETSWERYSIQLNKLHPFENSLTEIQSQMDSRPYLLEYLEQEQIRMSDLRGLMEQETREPVVVLPAR